MIKNSWGLFCKFSYIHTQHLPIQQTSFSSFFPRRNFSFFLRFSQQNKLYQWICYMSSCKFNNKNEQEKWRQKMFFILFWEWYQVSDCKCNDSAWIINWNWNVKILFCFSACLVNNVSWVLSNVNHFERLGVGLVGDLSKHWIFHEIFDIMVVAGIESVQFLFEFVQLSLIQYAQPSFFQFAQLKSNYIVCFTFYSLTATI